MTFMIGQMSANYVDIYMTESVHQKTMSLWKSWMIRCFQYWPLLKGKVEADDSYLHQIGTFQHEIFMCLEIEKWEFYIIKGLDSIIYLLAKKITTTTIWIYAQQSASHQEIDNNYICNIYLCSEYYSL